jgi:hypothetical protein
MVSAFLCDRPGHDSARLLAIFRRKLRVAIFLLVVGVITGMLENSPLIPPIADGLPTRKPSETSSSPLAQGNPPLLTCRELDGRTSAAKAFDRLVADIESDLGGSDRLSAIERALVEGFAGAAVTLQHLNTQLARSASRLIFPSTRRR